MKYSIPLLGKSVNFLSDLNDSDRQDLASKLVDRYPFSCENTIIEYVLQKSYEDSEAPFSHDDISNNQPTGSIEINGYWVDLTEEERDEKLSHYEYLRDKAENINDLRFGLFMTNENDLISGSLDLNHEKSSSNFERLSNIFDELESLDFDNYPEIYQWFAVDQWIAGQLNDLGECILDSNYWGRTCCGQSIVLDHCIQTIAFNVFSVENVE